MGLRFSASDKVEPDTPVVTKMNYGRSNEKQIGIDFKPEKRHSTDVFFLIVFIIFLLTLAGLFGYCAINGNILRIIYGYDSCGNICGIKQDPIIYDSKCLNKSVENKPYRIVLKSDKANEPSIRQCVANCSDHKGYRPFFHRCLPGFISKDLENVYEQTGIRNFFTEFSVDVSICAHEIIGLSAVALILSLVVMFAFRFIIGFIVWVFFIGAVVVSLGGSVTLWILYTYSKNRNFNQRAEVSERKTTTYFAFAIAATILTGVLILIIFVLRKRIKLMVQLFKEAGKALAAIPCLIFTPILTFVILISVMALWVYVGLLIESSGIISEKSPHVYHYKKDLLMVFTRWYNLLAGFWLCQFIISCQHFTIAGAVSDWFFARNKQTLNSPILRNIKYLLRYHLGSIALGALLIAIVQVFRVILKYVELQLERSENRFLKIILKCCQCCLCCFEKILKFLSKNAYIEIAIHSMAFCPAAKKAFFLLVDNAVRVTVINSVGDFLLFLGKLLVVILTVFIGSKMLHDKETVEHMWLVLLFIGFISYFVAHCFISLYEMIIDTIFICFCEDCAENDGISKPYYMSRGLMEFVENSRKAIELYEKNRKTPIDATDIVDSTKIKKY